MVGSDGAHRCRIAVVVLQNRDDLVDTLHLDDDARMRDDSPEPVMDLRQVRDAHPPEMSSDAADMIRADRMTRPTAGGSSWDYSPGT
jgi:hypothetical protein